MIYLTEKDLLKIAVENGIIDLSTIQIQVEMNERKKYLDKHNSDIWKGADGKWHTYISDSSKTEGRRRIKRKTKESLENALIDAYKEQENEPTIEQLFYLWTSKKMEYGEMQRQTFDRYERDFKRYFGSKEIANRKVRYFSEEELEDFIKLTIKQSGLTAKAWSNLRTLINGMFKFAKKRGYSKINISNFMQELDLSKKAFAPKIRNDADNVFTELEVEKIISYVNKNPCLNGYGILIAIYTGMRVGEIVSLKHEDVFKNYLYVRRTQIRYKENGKDVYEIRNSPKTDAGVRKVAITPKLIPVINKLKMENFDNEYLFWDKENKKIKTIHALTCYLYRVCEQVGIHKRSMHVLRKTYATQLLNAGIDGTIITNQLGHTNLDTTKEYYYYNDKSIDQIAQTIGSAINF